MALLIEVLDEAMRLLPPTIPVFTKLKTYEPILDLQRRRRQDARGPQAGGSEGIDSKQT
jgi:hypothetical protein